MLEIFCDFDGTISQGDATDALLERFASPRWRAWEALWQSGAISARECLTAQVALVRVDRASLVQFIRGISIDDAVITLAKQCAEMRIPLTIVSDGLDCIIKGVLHHHGLSHVPYFANRAVWHAPDRLSLSFPHAEPGCESGVCKCRLTRRAGAPSAHQRVYIGDGRSDFCVVQQMDHVYAKGALIEWCQRQHISFDPFTSLDQVVTQLCPEGVVSR